MMDDFTVENGATACVPFTQREASWPDEDLFDKSFIQKNPFEIFAIKQCDNSSLFIYIY